MKYLSHIKIVIVASVALLVSFGGLLWLQTMLSEQGDLLQQQIALVTNKNAFEEQLRTITTTLEESATEREQLSRYIIKDEADTIALLSRFDQIAIDQQVELKTSQLNVIETDSTYNQLELRYTLKGSESAVMHLVSMFETLPYHGHVESFSLTRSATEAVVDATIGLRLSIEKYD